MNEFVFWQDAPSIHQSAFIRQLALSSNARVKLVVWEETNARRKASGCPDPDFGLTQVIVKPSLAEQVALLSETGPGSVHIFSGPRGHPFVRNALRKSLRSDMFIGMMCEAHNGRGFKGQLRFLRCQWDARRYRGRVNMLLAMGLKGVKWYTKCGFPRNKVVPFGYFVDSPQIQNGDNTRCTTSSGIFDLIFVGDLMPHKAWDVLLHALHGFARTGWRLHVVGNGPDKARFLSLCRKLRLDKSVRLYGVQPRSVVIDLISRSDLLVLPSRWDGWGAVINEALMCGVPVVCSDRCGAMDLLDGDIRGEVVHSECISALRDALWRRISQGKIDMRTRQAIKNWSNCISGQAAASYFLSVIEASINGRSKPVPPWLATEQR
jgi:glycosyltransferase involved in cell wall biosynthesis